MVRLAPRVPWLPLFTCAVLATVMAHGMILAYPLQFDDINQLRGNPALRDFASLGRVWTDPWVGFASGHSASYRPLLYTMFIVESELGGGAVWVHRAVSLVMLALFAALAGRFASALLGRLDAHGGTSRSDRAGLYVAALVALHPLYAQSVLLVSSRSSLLMGCFALAALLAVLEPGPRPRRQVAALLFTTLALLAKESGVILVPLAAVLVFATHERTGPLDWIRRLAPVVLPVAVYVAWHRYQFNPVWLASGSTEAPLAIIRKAPGIDHTARGGIVLLGFLKLLVVPWGLSPVHLVPSPEGVLRWVGYGVWPVLTVLGLVGWLRGGGARIAGLGLLWFLAGLFPSLLLVRLNVPFSEHRAALAAVLPLAALAWWLAGLPGAARRRALIALIGSTLLLMTLVQQWPWRSPGALWEWQAGIEPTSSRAWSFLAGARFDEGDYRAAGVANARARELAPGNPIHLELGASIAAATGRRDDALRLAQRALAIEPNLAGPHLLLAEFAALAGNLDEAATHAGRAVALAPANSPAWNGLGNVRWMQGDQAGAREAYREALRLDPGNAMARENLGRLAR